MSQIVPVSSITTTLGSSIEGFEGNVIKPSQLMLVHRGTKGAGEHLQMGKLVDTLTNQHYDSVRAVALAMRPGRVYFPPDKVAGGTPLCRSNDGLVPAPNVPAKQASRCDICDHGPKVWGRYKLTGEKPTCDETVNMLFIERESGFPFYMTVKGTSLKGLKDIKQAMFRDILMNKAKGVTYNMWDYTFEIKPASISGNKGNYFLLNFMNLQKVATPGEYGPLHEMFVKSQRPIENESNVEAIMDAEVIEPDYDPSQATYQDV